MASTSMSFDAASLGNKEFRRRYGIKYAYLAGAMYRGIASKELVVRMAKANLMSFLGTAGMPLTEVEAAIRHIQQHAAPNAPYGMNILSDMEDPAHEMRTVELYARYGIRFIEAAAYIQVSPALVWFRLQGLRQDDAGKVYCTHHILAKVSRPEVAAAFLAPAPEKIVRELLAQGKITAQQAEWSARVPLSSEICVEADSGGHTDMGIPTVIFPAMVRQRDDAVAAHGWDVPVFIGLAGGIGSPQSAAAAFVMGADFILTGSINQCTVEGGTSDVVKDILQDINVQDTDYAPAGDMFELGAKVQVLKRGVFFPARANKLHALYTQYASLTEIPATLQQQIQQRYFKRSFEDIWNEVKHYLAGSGRQQEIARIEANPKQKMARVFKWYFAYTTRLALSGDEANKVDFQVHTGPALGSFNQWLKGTPLESWRARHVDDIAERLMQAAAQQLAHMFAALSAGGA